MVGIFLSIFNFQRFPNDCRPAQYAHHRRTVAERANRFSCPNFLGLHNAFY